MVGYVKLGGWDEDSDLVETTQGEINALVLRSRAEGRAEVQSPQRFLIVDPNAPLSTIIEPPREMIAADLEDPWTAAARQVRELMHGQSYRDLFDGQWLEEKDE